MRRTPLYSASSARSLPTARPAAPAAATQAPAAAAAPSAASPAAARRRPWLAATAAALVGATLALLLTMRFGAPGARALTQDDIDRAVLHTLNTKTLPSPAAKAFEAVRGSVVKVIGISESKPAITTASKDGKDDKDAKKGKDGKPAPEAKKGAQPKVERDGNDNESEQRGVGTGVVILDNGTILTNLHVVFGAKRIKVIFADGLEADADVIALRPEHDLAVLRAQDSRRPEGRHDAQHARLEAR